MSLDTTSVHSAHISGGYAFRKQGTENYPQFASADFRKSTYQYLRYESKHNSVHYTRISGGYTSMMNTVLMVPECRGPYFACWVCILFH